MLEDAVVSLLAASMDQVVELFAEHASDAQMALQHLAALPFADQLHLTTDWSSLRSHSDSTGQLTVLAHSNRDLLQESTWQIAPWTDDDLIEFLLSKYPEKCSAVMAQIRSDPGRDLLNGSPSLSTLVVEKIVKSNKPSDIRSALRQVIIEKTGERTTLESAQDFSARRFLGTDQLFRAKPRDIERRLVEKSLIGLLSHRSIQLLLTADRLKFALNAQGKRYFPTKHLSMDLIDETALAIKDDQKAIKKLRVLAKSDKGHVAPMAASVLHRVDPNWQPSVANCASLSGASLKAAMWDGVNLAKMDLRDVNLRRSRLVGANLSRSMMNGAKLSGCDFTRADFSDSKSFFADFRFANLTSANLDKGVFASAQLTSACLDHAHACDACFIRSNLTDASLNNVRLTHCDLSWATLKGAKLQGAVLIRCQLSDLCLQDTDLCGVLLESCCLDRANMEFIELHDVVFDQSSLYGALLTGSKMRNASLQNVRLRNAGLADIEWEGADLRGTDLSGASFHLGSTRSGLVDSPIASHGTRTGYYTDDYNDHSYKDPEEIRKANLSGADLRGAFVDDVDFYLVDLRDAKYDSSQEEHFRRCDAILE